MMGFGLAVLSLECRLLDLMCEQFAAAKPSDLPPQPTVPSGQAQAVST
jgi:hypothetical protein